MTLPPRISTCHRHPHPNTPITGLCPSCLRERLAGIDPDTHQETPITHLAAELRRSKSYSSNSNQNASSSSTTTTTTTTATTVSEPRRKSCDVRARNSLFDLFHQDDKKKRGKGSNGKSSALGFGVNLKEEEENVGEIRVSKEPVIDPNGNGNGNEGSIFEEDAELKTMKEFIDLEWERKRNGGRDLKDIAGSFWEAASLFSKKLVKWQGKQKKKMEPKHGNCGGVDLPEILRPIVGRHRETQSEIGEYGFGRRSCDTDPRLSVDVGRLSIDDSGCSFDEPRASWDGCLTGKTYPKLTPLVSVLEDVKLPTDEVENPKNEVDISPGGTAQTRDYYSDRRRRRSFDRSVLSRRGELVDDEFKALSNAKVSPETLDLFQGAKLLVTEKELRDSNWYSVKANGAESVDTLSKDESSAGVAGISERGFKFKKSHRWRNLWNVWGLMQKRSESKMEDEEISTGENVVDRPVPDPLRKLNDIANGEANGVVSPQLLRSHTVSSRDPCRMASCASTFENKENGSKRREDLVLQRNRSPRYSPNNLENGMLRFYLTPLRSYGRSKSGKSRLHNSQSMAKNCHVKEH
ncbi:hypothetical protein K2173_012327 [Erythroxylum novogranatense]|uniref:Uncharacterized protein n=1 Tax=Erythroxylum novogranatense TaxID=1862640 RepID=A0AAV8SCM7_9ROSI|nr:hypothetical protein K2173_012327 [Erythroxylum novogranatense]